MTKPAGSGGRRRGAHSRPVKTQTPRTWKAGTPAPEPKTPLGILVAKQMEAIGIREQGHPLSYRQVADRSGGLVSAPTVGNVIRGKNRNPDDATFEGLSAALACDETLLRKAWRAGQDQEWTLPSKFQQLDMDGWSDLIAYGEFLLGKQKKSR